MATDSTPEPIASRAGGRTRSETKRAAILESAGALFLSQGPEGTSMDAVAREAGVSKQTVYSHFGDKESLFAQCIENKVNSYRLGDLPDLAALDLASALRELATRLMDLFADSDVINMHRVVINASTTHPEIGALFYENGIRRTVGAVSRLLDAHVQAGHVHIDDTDEAAALFIDMLAGHMLRRLMLRQGEPPDEAARSDRVDLTVKRFVSLFPGA